MSLNRYARKRDLAEPLIIEALERAGYQVWQGDKTDLCARKSWWLPGIVQLLEVKTGRGKKLTIKKDKRQTAQQEFLTDSLTPIVRTPEEALTLLDKLFT